MCRQEGSGLATRDLSEWFVVAGIGHAATSQRPYRSPFVRQYWLAERKHSAERFQPLYSPPGVDAKRQPADDAGALFMAAEY